MQNSESNWDRAKQDTLFAFSTVRFWVFDGLFIIVLTISVILWQPDFASKGTTMTIYQILVPFIGGLMGLVVVFLISLFLRAPSKIKRSVIMEIATKLKGIDIAGVRDFQTTLLWLKSIYISQIPFGEQYSENDYFKVRLAIESGEEWNYLKIHRSHIVKDVEIWEEIEHEDLVARKQLLDAIYKKVKETFNIPIRSDDINVDKDGKPFLTIFLVANLYEVIFCKVAGIDNTPLQKWYFEIDENKGCVYYPNRGYPLICSDNAKQLNDVIELLINSQTSLLGLPEAESAKQALNKAKDETANLKRQFEAIISKA